MEFKVSFLLGGAQKSGTTALDAYLRNHPDICMANFKEVHYFDNDAYFAATQPDYRDYHRFFQPQSRHILIGESTPSYMYWPDAPGRICAYNSAMRWILVLRNPIERAFSHWNMQRVKRLENLEFIEALKAESQRLADKKHAYIGRGYYSRQLKNILEYFPKTQLLLLKYENFKNDPLATLNKVYAFLEIEPITNVDEKNIFTAEYKATLTREARSFLCLAFETEIRELEYLLGWDCRDWLN